MKFISDLCLMNLDGGAQKKDERFWIEKFIYFFLPIIKQIWRYSHSSNSVSNLKLSNALM